MLRTNLSDRRALGGLLGTAIIGIVGLAVGLSVIGIIIGGIIGAVVGNYAGRSIKENAMRKKKLLHVDLEVIKLAAFCSHIIEAEDESISLAELRLASYIFTIILFPFLSFFRFLIQSSMNSTHTPYLQFAKNPAYSYLHLNVEIINLILDV